MSDSSRERRTWIYSQRPRDYEISGCPTCGNPDPDFSEFKHMLWCATCKVDFVPASGGIFDGPICVHAMELLGIDLRQYDIETGAVIFDPCSRRSPAMEVKPCQI